MPAIRRFEDIEAWKKARELVREVYKICGEGRLSKDFGLRDQLCRAAVSSMSNIAEGFSRNSDKDFSHFLDMAKGSALEVQSLLYVALDIEYIEKSEFDRLSHLADATASIIGGFISYLRKQIRHSTLDTGH
jgi:four helix bundle protein